VVKGRNNDLFSFALVMNDSWEQECERVKKKTGVTRSTTRVKPKLQELDLNNRFEWYQRVQIICIFMQTGRDPSLLEGLRFSSWE
jgi:hypothetical protein